MKDDCSIVGCNLLQARKASTATKPGTSNCHTPYYSLPIQDFDRLLLAPADRHSTYREEMPYVAKDP